MREGVREYVSGGIALLGVLILGAIGIIQAVNGSDFKTPPELGVVVTAAVAFYFSNAGHTAVVHRFTNGIMTAMSSRQVRSSDLTTASAAGAVVSEAVGAVLPSNSQPPPVGEAL